MFKAKRQERSHIGPPSTGWLHPKNDTERAGIGRP